MIEKMDALQKKCYLELVELPEGNKMVASGYSQWNMRQRVLWRRLKQDWWIKVIHRCVVYQEKFAPMAKIKYHSGPLILGCKPRLASLTIWYLTSWPFETSMLQLVGKCRLLTSIFKDFQISYLILIDHLF